LTETTTIWKIVKPRTESGRSPGSLRASEMAGSILPREKLGRRQALLASCEQFAAANRETSTPRPDHNRKAKRNCLRLA
jgi:hypothetical protein